MKRGYQSITVDDIKAQRARLFVRERLKIAVVGNIDAATLAPLLDKLLGGLPAKASCVADAGAGGRRPPAASSPPWTCRRRSSSSAA